MSCSPNGRVERDPQLHNFYKKHLLEPGWAGCLDPSEAQYIENRLKTNALLRWRWGFKGTSVPLRSIIARAFVEDPTAGQRSLQSDWIDQPLPDRADPHKQSVKAKSA